MVYSIYKEGGPEERRQRQMNSLANKVTTPAQTVIKTATAPARKLMGAVASPILTARDRQKKFMGDVNSRVIGKAADRPTAGPERMMHQGFAEPTINPVEARKGLGAKPSMTGTAQAAAIPDMMPSHSRRDVLPNRQATGKQPATSPMRNFNIGEGGKIVQSDRQGPGINVNFSDRDNAIKKNLADIDARLASGVIPTSEQSARIQDIRRQAGFLRGGTDRVPVGRDGLPLRQGPQNTRDALSGYDQNQSVRVNSDGFTFEGAAGDAGRFFANTGKGDPVAERNRVIQQQQWQDRQPKERIVDSGQNLMQGVAGGGGWKARMSRDNAIINANAQLASSAMSEKSAAERNRIDASRLGIDRENFVSQDRARQSNIDANQYTMNEKKQIEDVRQQYLKEENPARKKALQEQYFTLNNKTMPEKKVFDVPRLDDVGQRTGTDFYTTDDEGNVIPAQMGGAQGGEKPKPTPESMDFYRKNVGKDPSLKQWFEKLYGYPPPE